MSKTERQAEVETLTAALKASPNVYVTDFSGLIAQFVHSPLRLHPTGHQ